MDTYRLRHLSIKEQTVICLMYSCIKYPLSLQSLSYLIESFVLFILTLQHLPANLNKRVFPTLL